MGQLHDSTSALVGCLGIHSRILRRLMPPSPAFSNGEVSKRHTFLIRRVDSSGGNKGFEGESPCAIPFSNGDVSGCQEAGTLRERNGIRAGSKLSQDTDELGHSFMRAIHSQQGHSPIVLNLCVFELVGARECPELVQALLCLRQTLRVSIREHECTQLNNLKPQPHMHMFRS